MIDPRLKESRRVVEETWRTCVGEFMQSFGRIEPWHIRIYLHLEEAARQDPRPFAYAYVVWKDAAGRFHMFRERWVLHEGAWFTRVAGLTVANT